MDRGKNNLTDDSVTNCLKGLIMSTHVAAPNLFAFSNGEMRTASPKVILRRLLSTKSAMSVESSLAEASLRAKDNAI